jgi:hypothetical protein
MIHTTHIFSDTHKIAKHSAQVHSVLLRHSPSQHVRPRSGETDKQGNTNMAQHYTTCSSVGKLEQYLLHGDLWSPRPAGNILLSYNEAPACACIRGCRPRRCHPCLMCAWCSEGAERGPVQRWVRTCVGATLKFKFYSQACPPLKKFWLTTICGQPQEAILRVCRQA